MGHVKQVLAVDWSPDGHRIATGSDDHTVRIWDLRVQKCEYVIPAHASLISSVRFEPMGGRTLLTASYDQTVKARSIKGSRASPSAVTPREGSCAAPRSLFAAVIFLGNRLHLVTLPSPRFPGLGGA